MPPLLAILVAGAASPGAAAAAPPQAVDAQRPRLTPSGHRFLVPSGWRLARRGPATVLEAPEGGSYVVFVEVRATSHDQALARAWRAYRGVAAPPPVVIAPLANANGWRDGRSYTLPTGPGAPRILTARVLRRGPDWAVRIDDLASSVAGKRAADLSLIRDEFLPRGYVRESFAGRAARPLTPARLAALTDFVERSRHTLGVPGVALGLIAGGKTQFSGGFGQRRFDRPAKVDADTLFLTASTTKQLTSLMLAKLVDEGKFGWDTPVVRLMPQFAVADPAITPRVTMRHLVCACSGLPYRNLDWEFAPPGAPASLTFDILGRMRSTSPFDSSYQYSNPIAAAAGYVAGQVAFPGRGLGAAYDQAMASRVFAPLGMRRTTFDFDQAMRGNFAPSHGVAPDGRFGLVEVARDRKVAALRPMGGAWSNVTDLLAYLAVELNGGRTADGQRYISEAALKARWAPQIGTGKSSWYGMGLETDVSRGTPMLFHGGRLYGQRSNIVWWPEHGVGLVLLMNASSGDVLMNAVPPKLIELLFDGEPEADSMVAAAAAAERAQRDARRRGLTLPANPAHAAGLAARYRNPMLGELRIRQTAQGPLFDLGAWQALAASRDGPGGSTEFVLLTPSPPGPFVAGAGPSGRTLTVREAQNDFVFVEVRD